MKLSVGLRLGVQTGVAVLLCSVIGYFGLRGLRTVTTTVEEMTITNTALYHHLQGDMMHDALRADVFGAFLAENPADAKQVMADTLEHSAEFRKMVQLNSELRLNAEVAQAIEAIKPKLDEYIKGAQAMVDLALHDRAAAKARLPQFLNLFGELEDLQASASERISNSAARAGHEEEKVIGQTQTTMFAVGAACLVFLAGIGYWTYRVILIPLRSCLSVLTECSKGNLSCRTEWKSSDEFGVLASVTNMLTQNFSNMIGEVQQSAIAVASAATEIASSANEMSCAVDDVAKQTTRTSESASESGRIAKDGGEVVRQTVEGMQQINSAVNASAASVTELGNRGREIGEIISVINGIADQTNLLALNAAIEAARAGEHGRGFAVVADEVRKLAERTSKATEEVGESIKAIQKETDEAVQRMNTGTEQVKLGVDLATQAGASLQQIVSGAGDVAGMVQSISAAAEQAGAGARQSADAATQLSGKAERLQSLVSRFQLAATR